MSQGKSFQSGGRQKERKRVIEKGIVMSVPSGDRLVVYCMDNQPQGQKWTPPKKKEIKLSGIQAPSAGRNRKKEKPKGTGKGKGTTGKDENGPAKGKNSETPKGKPEKNKENAAAPTQGDKEAKAVSPAQEKEEPPQPYFWESRNFLRELTIGKVVEYEIFRSAKQTTDPKNKPAANSIPREIGNVKLQGEQDSLSRIIVAAGWATVKAPKEKQDSTGPPKSITELLAIQAEAQKAGRGIHAPKNKSQPVNYALLTDFDHWQKYKEWKGQKLTGIVEAVINGSFLRITLAPMFHSIPLRIAGVRCPNFKKDGTSEPFGKEAQFTTERYVLNRTVQIKLSAFEQQSGKKEDEEEEKQDHGTYHGEIFLNDKSIGELLLQSGLAAFVEWSCPKEKIDLYKGLELQAQQSRLRMWQVADAVQKNLKPQTSWMGRVKGVLSGSTLTIQNLEANPPRLETITLSSIVVPQLRRGDVDDPEPLAWEAKEFVRKRLIGKKVRVTLDYVRPEMEAKPQPNKPADEKEGQDAAKQQRGGRGRGKGKNARKKAGGKEKIPEKPFYTVEHDKRNIALALVENGLATVQQRGGDNRSPHYDALILAQDRAKQKHLGLHSKQELGKHHINDISRDPKRAKQMYATLEGKRHEAVVEYVISGSRLKLHLPRENLMITFALAGVRTPSIPAKKQEKKKGGKEGEEPKTPEKEVPPPPFAVESRDFTREFCHHFDVEIEIEGQDSSGTFRGNLIRKKKNLAVLLLEEGLATVSVPGSKTFGDLYASLEAKAKEERKNIWKDWDPVKEAENLKRLEEENAANSSNNSNSSGPVKVLLQVTEVLDGGTFYSQIVGDEKTQLEQMMKQIAARDNAADPPFKAAAKDVVLARFSGDQAWYRAQVMHVTDKGEYRVFYGDYGNVETTDASQVRALPPEFGLEKLRWQARETKLAYIEPRKLEQEWGEKAALVFKRLVWDKELMACIEYNRNGVMHVTLWDENKLFINAELVRKGLARVERRPPRYGNRQELIKFLREQEESAHENHKGLWEHGDPGYSDEEI